MDQRKMISGGFYLFLSLMILLLPLKWVIAMILAAVFHELCHYVSIRLLTGQDTGVRVRFAGAQMDLPPISRGGEIICALAGPVGSFALIGFAPYFPELAMCGLIHGLYNLLPVYPLDGGRILYCLATMLFSVQLAKKICKVIEIILSIILIIVAIWAAVGLKWGMMPLIAAASLFFKLFF